MGCYSAFAFNDPSYIQAFFAELSFYVSFFVVYPIALYTLFQMK
jgi:hypothetical protein